MMHYPSGAIFQPTVHDTREPLQNHRRPIADLLDSRPDLWAVACAQCRNHTLVSDGTHRPIQPHYFGSRQEAETAIRIGVEVHINADWEG